THPTATSGSSRTPAPTHRLINARPGAAPSPRSSPSSNASETAIPGGRGFGGEERSCATQDASVSLAGHTQLHGDAEPGHLAFADQELLRLEPGALDAVDRLDGAGDPRT